MNTELINKTIEYYQPEKFGYGNINLKAVNKILPCSDHEIMLTFGYQAKDKEDALKNGGYVTTSKELYQNLFPEEWAKIKSFFEDIETTTYLENFKKRIGYIDRVVDEEEVDFSYVNLTLSGDTKIGKDKQDRWVSEHFWSNNIDDWKSIKDYYSRKPSEQDFRNLMAVKDFEHHFRFKGYDKGVFKCWECGRKTHWTELPGSISNKWRMFQEKYCGC
ncbi:UNVERIFIED_CONTAM: hypothetical protein ABIC26_002736 [Paenibacillus sp. PvR008]